MNDVDGDSDDDSGCQAQTRYSGTVQDGRTKKRRVRRDDTNERTMKHDCVLAADCHLDVFADDTPGFAESRTGVVAAPAVTIIDGPFRARRLRTRALFVISLARTRRDAARRKRART